MARTFPISLDYQNDQLDPRLSISTNGHGFQILLFGKEIGGITFDGGIGHADGGYALWFLLTGGGFSGHGHADLSIPSGRCKLAAHIYSLLAKDLETTAAELIEVGE